MQKEAAIKLSWAIWNLAFPKCGVLYNGAFVRGREGGKRKGTICRNKMPWTWGKIYWEWEPSSISSADRFVRNRIKPS